MVKHVFNASYATITNSYLTNTNVQNFATFLFENDFIITNAICNDFVKTVMSRHSWYRDNAYCVDFYGLLYIHLRDYFHLELLSLYPHFVDFATTCEINAKRVLFCFTNRPNTIRIPYNEPKLNNPILLAFLTETNIKHIIADWMKESRKRKDFTMYFYSFIRNCQKLQTHADFVQSRSFYFYFCGFCKINLGRTHNAFFPFPRYFYYIMKMHILLIMDEYNDGIGFDAKNVGNRVFADVWIVKNVCGFL
jgi:hypothetical protein